MSQQEIQLPKGWRILNLWCLHASYSFFVPLAFMQVPIAERILKKAFGTEFYDIASGWILILLLISMSGAGIFAAIKMTKFKKIINILENDDKPNP